jgi:hypothetical protein
MFLILLIPYLSRSFREGFLSATDIAFPAVGARVVRINVHTLRILARSVQELPTLVFCRLQCAHLIVPLEPQGLFPFDECRWCSVDHFIAMFLGHKRVESSYSLYAKNLPQSSDAAEVFWTLFASQIGFSQYMLHRMIHVPRDVRRVIFSWQG